MALWDGMNEREEGRRVVMSSTEYDDGNCNMQMSAFTFKNLVRAYPNLNIEITGWSAVRRTI